MIRQLMGLIGIFGLVGCSAIELNQQQAQATQQTEDTIAQTVESRIQQTDVAINATYDVIGTQVASTSQALATQAGDIASNADDMGTRIAQATTAADEIATQIAATILADLESTEDPDGESTAEATPEPEAVTLPTNADITQYGAVPIDSDSLNSITALAFDDDGALLVSLRSGEIYQLQDTDDDGVADETDLIFDDADNELSQVSGLFLQDSVLYVLHGDQLSQLQDTDDDGIYDSVAHLSDDLPAAQALLQANNSIVQSPDGRYFTADVNSGDILMVTLISD